jgi:hypothetical protein
MHDLFLPAASHKNFENKENQGCFSSDVYHPFHRIVSLADLWTYAQRFATDSGQYSQFKLGNVCSGTQDTARVKTIWQYLYFSKA